MRNILIQAVVLMGFVSSCTTAPQILKEYTVEFENIQYKFTAYGSEMIRVQAIPEGEYHLPDDRYEMVESHDWDGQLEIIDRDGITTIANGKAKFEIVESGSFKYYVGEELVLNNGSFVIKGDTASWSFTYDSHEHFAGLGHDYTGRLDKLDLQGELIRRNYGRNDNVLPTWEYQMQAPLLVPFYFSSKNYGIFLNSPFPNYFDFGSKGIYQFGIDDQGYTGQMDVFFMSGNSPKDLINCYVDLTGKPRLPQLSIFGLQLSDKVHDHKYHIQSDEKWWRQQITEHREAGYPLDHLVNDNRWRAGGGTRCESRFEWEKERYPDPAAYKVWLDSMGLTFTLDFNRCIAEKSAGWMAEYNIEIPEGWEFHEFPGSNPDFTNPEVRDWIWNLFYSQALDPALQYPGDALWIDEVDALYTVPYITNLHKGNWAEMSNHWYVDIGKALVGDGWDNSEINKRPYVWMRGMSAGAQRYGTMWSGDIGTNFPEMKRQVRGMVSAGLSGVPFWGHDAGGFTIFPYVEHGSQPEDPMYARWAMQMGVFSPIWKPHGVGQSRWPLDRSEFSQKVAMKYSKIRYEMMPYSYSFAHHANQTGTPMTRAMFLDYPDQDEAWSNDLQYMWGEYLLIVPMFEENQRQAWIPEGSWYDFNTGLKTEKKGKVNVEADLMDMPIFVKAGAIIPNYEYALSTFYYDKTKLKLNVYTGSDGMFTLIEDDGVTEKYLEGEKQETAITYSEATHALTIAASQGQYENMPTERQVTCMFYGISEPVAVELNREVVVEEDVTFDEAQQTITVVLPTSSINKELTITLK